MPTSPFIRPHQATEAIESQMSPARIESLPLSQCAGRTLRENVYAERDQPPFDRVTMDGIAVDASALRSGVSQFNIQATQVAGAARLQLKSAAEAIEVMTGAILPLGADCVIPVEQLDVAKDVASLRCPVNAEKYHNVHRRGSDALQGRLLLEAGVLLRAPEIAIVASAGMARVNVSRQPAIMVMSTGDELIEPGHPIAEFQVRRSNAYGVAAALRRRGLIQVSDDHVLDDATELRRRLQLHLSSHDLLLLSGGVSMGKFDLVPKVLAQLGVQQVFHRVAQRPGKPLWFGIGPRGQAVFGLPGNPVSTLVCLIRYVIPSVAVAMGTQRQNPQRVVLADSVEVQTDMAYFLPVAIAYDESGRAWASPKPTHGSGDFLSLAGTDGFVELPPGPTTHRRGFMTRLYSW